ncbi:MAG: hypothetical protein K9J37_10575 [Saprospiraceae bacterium]|nr:hypothetical protein [Saprospiraceae bacterium]MCF8250349.1 hypothetical protein [Saprospiraceae bacterium]MCF8280414.1 hypothetical protein [Bacteroidales bacterium]MCF8312157.1 hypothetical protein [Saprospiraceae bacterium]MCF8441879.1 hypothetical protein [Saprospiraceae bacterium]
MAATVSAQDQIASFIADAMPERILSFKFSSSVQKRIELLVNRKKEGFIDNQEQEELERYLLYDNLIGLAKARASMKIAGK